MSYVPTDYIEVLAWGTTVGFVALDPRTRVYAFEYTADWVERGIELAPLHMPNRPSGAYTFPSLSRDTFYGLPGLLADALPDAFGNALVNAWMARRGIADTQITPLDRLAYAADRAMGALQFLPSARAGAEPASGAVQLADLVLAARRTVRGDVSTDGDSESALQQLIEVGTAAGGARAKAVVAFDPDTYRLRSAHEHLAPGFEHWLLKLDGVSGTGMDGHGDRLGDSAPHGRTEYAYSLMARAAGIEMAPCLLLAEGPRRHFMTQRFDRGPTTRRIHMISLCALAHLDYNLVGVHSYDQLFQTIAALGMSPDARTQAYRRMVFNVAAANNDDHTKNFAFLRRTHGPWELSPAYDLTHAHNPTSPWTSRHLMSVNGTFSGVTLADLYAVAERNEVPGYRLATREVLQAVGAWPDYADAAELDADRVVAVADDLADQRPR